MYACMVVSKQCSQEAYLVGALMSYSRRYWRRTRNRNSQMDMAEKLAAVCKPNPRNARASLRKKRKPEGRGNVDRRNACVVSFSLFLYAGERPMAMGENAEQQAPVPLQYG